MSCLPADASRNRARALRTSTTWRSKTVSKSAFTHAAKPSLIQSSSSQSHGVNKFFTSQSPLHKQLGFTTGILDLDEAQKVLSRNRLRESGTSFLCKRLLATSTTQSYMNDFTCPITQVVQSSSTRTPSTPTSMSNHLPPRHQANLARSYCRRRTWLGLTRCCVTCFLSACCSQWPNSLHCFITTHQQCLRREKRYCQEHHPDHSCSNGLPKHWFTCR